MEYKELALDTLAAGSVLERIQGAIQEVAENIRDLDTDPKAKRSVTLKLEFRPSADRENVELRSHVKVALAPEVPVVSPVWLVNKRDGVKAMTANPRQEVLDLEDEDRPQVTHIGRARAQGDDG